MRDSDDEPAFVDPTTNTAHRPWPLPERPWVMTQRWSNLLFMHWPVETKALRALVPAALDLDVRDNTAWITVAPFYLSHLRARGLPTLPWGSEFPELNVRTYVSVGGKAGVYFFSLDAGSELAVMGARTFFHLPYFHATMSVRAQNDGTVTYASERRDGNARLHGSYIATGPVNHTERGSLDHWLSERYCLYALDSAGVVHRADIHHEPWPLQPARIDIRENTMAAAAGITLPAIPPRVSFAKMIDVVVWTPERAK